MHRKREDKKRIFWCCPRAFTSNSFGFLGKQTVVFNGNRPFVTLWNALKPDFKLRESLIIFSRKMKAFFLNQFLMS